MASLMETLIDVLDQECDEYEQLLELSRRKTPVIVKGDLEELQRITEEEQDYAGRITNLEKKRTDIYGDIANVLNRDITELKLDFLIQVLESRPLEREALARIHDRLRAAVRGLEQVNAQNQELLNNALEMIDFEMTLLQSMKAAPETANYNRGAYSSGSTMGVNSGGFDAKQ